MAGAKVGRQAGGLRRKILILFLSAMGLSFIVKSVVGDKGLLDIYHKRLSLEQTKQDIEQLQRENARLRHDIARLQDDPIASEEIARRELGLTHPDEYVIVIKDKRQPDSPSK